MAGAIKKDRTAKEYGGACRAANKGSPAKSGRGGPADTDKTKFPAPKKRGQEPQTIFTSAYSLPPAHVPK